MNLDIEARQRRATEGHVRDFTPQDLQFVCDEIFRRFPDNLEVDFARKIVLRASAAFESARACSLVTRNWNEAEVRSRVLAAAFDGAAAAATDRENSEDALLVRSICNPSAF